MDVLANTVTGMKTKQDTLTNTLGYPPMADGPNLIDPEAGSAGTPT